MRHWGWITDPHLDALASDRIDGFLSEVYEYTDVIITGDISDDIRDTRRLISALARETGTRIHFVLGNHDFWSQRASRLMTESRHLATFASGCEYIGGSSRPISEGCTLVAVDGWYDCREGRPRMEFYPRDWDRIADFADLTFPRRLDLSRRIAAIEAERLGALLRGVRTPRAIVATHVPPWREAHTYNGLLSDDDHLPFFTSRVTGQSIEAAVRDNPVLGRVLVLSGHTHNRAVHRVSPEILCVVGDACDGDAWVQDLRFGGLDAFIEYSAGLEIIENAIS